MGPSPTFANHFPSIVVVDNFLKNPGEHREHALKLEYEKKKSVGVRSKLKNNNYAYKKIFENILSRNIIHWNGTVNGCYQWCKSGEHVVYHTDAQSYAGVIYLTPDAPLASGTSFWKSKNSGLMEYRARDHKLGNLTFGSKNEHLKDPDQWELVDQVANVYNRLVLWSGKKIHSATSYFGDNPENARLFQVFFFEC
jgi:hypothetical protein